MKDATGELSMTAVAVVAIAAIGIVFTTLIWPQIRTNILRSTYCSQAFNCSNCTDGMCDCFYCDNADDPSTCGDGKPIRCSDNNKNN